MPKVSVFDSISKPKNPKIVDLYEYLEWTRDGMWKDLVNECRSIKDKTARDEFKSNMYTTSLSGEFTYRNDTSLKEHSRVINIDLDHVENLNTLKSALIRDKYVIAVFLSASGDGLRVLFKIEPTKHREAFLGLSKYIFEEYGECADTNGINLSKPYVVSYDPYLFLNMNDFEEIPTFKKYVKETVYKNISNFVHTSDDFEMVFNQIKSRRVCICEDYLDYLKLGFALSEQFGENGRSYFHELCSYSGKYNARKADKQFDACLKSRGTGNKANISTFYYLAKINNISIVTETTRTIIRTTVNGKKAGLKKEQIIDNLKKFSNIHNAVSVVDKVFDSDTKFDDGDESLLEQLEMFIENNYDLQMNEVTGYLEQNNGTVLTPSDLNSMFVSAKKLMPKLDYQLMIRLLKSDFIKVYNPFYRFFQSDGIAVVLPAIPDKDHNANFKSPIIDLLAKTIENEDPSFTKFFLRKWIISIVSAAHKVHSPLLLCLLGGQNTGKTEWFRRLLPSELQAYYAESKLDKEKDDELLMTENILIMDDELSGKSKQDNLKLKNLTSKQWFSIRRPYGDHNEKILRLAVLCGTSNHLEILSDSTGNRRIIPIEVANVNKDLYNSIDKRELFLEAFRLYKEGFDWRITQNDIAFLNRDKDRFEMVVSERELIAKYFEVGNDESPKLSTTEIKVEIEILTKQKLNLINLGRELMNLGFIKKSSRNGYDTKKKWLIKRIGRTHENINENTPINNLIKKEEDNPDYDFNK